ncbi:hypothetical protein SHD_4040 [Shewanella decolorationis S12]|uniref:Uncharacterized protein n=1 Tax=Shewanella decolorationis S12 TaxID=1353536 RepID=A0ABP2YZR5_9GAMM|nr:hypothetical protein SHD_4040 [Shewanella decolorationis S12]
MSLVVFEKSNRFLGFFRTKKTDLKSKKSLKYNRYIVDFIHIKCF